MIFLAIFKIPKDILKTRWDILYNWIYWRVLNLLSANKVLEIRNIFLYNFCKDICIFLACIVFSFPWKIAEQLFFADVLYRAWFTLLSSYIYMIARKLISFQDEKQKLEVLKVHHIIWLLVLFWRHFYSWIITEG